MYRRDLITAEIEKLAQVLARMVGLKKELKFEEANDLFKDTLLTGFKLDVALLHDNDLTAFNNWLMVTDLGPEQLNLLGDFLYSELNFQDQLVSSQLIAKKLDLIYQRLAGHFQIVHLINLGRQQLIKPYL